MTTKSIAVFLSTALIIAFAGCKKSATEFPQPSPGPIENNAYVQFSANAVQLTNKQFYALVSIESKTGQELISNKKLTLNYIQGVYKTDKLLLQKGEYKLSKFIVVTALDTAVYAAPNANSAKASQVTSPLAITVNVSNFGINNAAVQVLKVNDSDAPQSYGYNETDFGFLPFTTVSVKLKINIGQVAYDSLPGKLLVTVTNNQGGQWFREIDLQKGINPVRVPEAYANYKFEVLKWNVSAIQNFTRTELQSATLIELETSRQPKRLIEEASFTETNAGLVPDSRTEYFYNSNNRLYEIKNYQKSIQVSGLPLTIVSKFKYAANELDSILRFDGNNTSTGYTVFMYQANKISNIASKSYDQETHAAFEYLYPGEHIVINGDYLFSNQNSMSYTSRFLRGNKISDLAQSSTGGFESGVYAYDDYINPKHQLGYPDLYFTNYSKNNLIAEQKNYAGAIPQTVPYKFEYVYDNDGYPKEVYVSYKGYSSQQHLYRIKRTYTYQ